MLCLLVLGYSILLDDSGMNVKLNSEDNAPCLGPTGAENDARRPRKFKIDFLSLRHLEIFWSVRRIYDEKIHGWLLVAP